MVRSRLVVLSILCLVFSGCKGTLVAPPAAPDAQPVGPIADEQVRAGEERFPVVVDGKWGYIDRSGDMVIEARFNEASNFAEGLARVREDTRYGFIDPNGEVVIAARFPWASDFAGGRARVVLPGAPEDLSSRTAMTSGKRLQAFVDPSGGVVISAVLAEARDFAPTERGMLAPVVRTQSKTYVPFGLSLFRFLTMRQQKTAPWSVVTSDGRTAFELDGVADVLRYSEGRAPIAVGEAWASGARRWGYVDTAGRIAIEPQFQAAGPFSEGLAAVARDDRFGYVDTTGAVTIPLRFERAGRFVRGIAPFRLDGWWGFVDRTGQVVVAPEYDLASEFADGLARVQKRGKFGYVTAEGAERIVPRYAYAQDFKNGLAFVRDDTREGYIDTSGEFVWSQAAQGQRP